MGKERKGVPVTKSPDEGLYIELWTTPFVWKDGRWMRRVFKWQEEREEFELRFEIVSEGAD